MTAHGHSVGPRPLRLVSGAGYPDWEAVYQDNATWVYRTIYSRVGNQADAEDLTTRGLPGCAAAATADRQRR